MFVLRDLVAATGLSETHVCKALLQWDILTEIATPLIHAARIGMAIVELFRPKLPVDLKGHQLKPGRKNIMGPALQLGLM